MLSWGANSAIVIVMAGLVPANPFGMAMPCLSKRDRRDKPGDDK
jgi:hypothetical protein